MQLNNTLTRYLICGFSVLLFYGCEKKDAPVNADWVFVNGSSHTLHIDNERGSELNFTLTPGERTTIYIEDGTGPENVTPKNYVTLFEFSKTIITIDNSIEYVLSSSDRIRHIGSYEAEKIGYNHYKFTYTFTDSEVAQWRAQNIETE